jgi:Protein of unknown function (DUF2804)
MRPGLVLTLAAVACSAERGQHMITAPGAVLTDDGRPREPGWSPRQLLVWDPARVHDPGQLRQWDFYSLQSDEAAVNLTLADLGFLRLATVAVVDLGSGERREATLIAGPNDTFALSGAVEGSAALVRAGAGPALAHVTGADGGDVTIAMPAPSLGPPATGWFRIQRRPGMPYLSLLTPFADDPHQFFFEQKVPGLSAEGMLTVGDRAWTFAGAAAVLDWGRGQWPSAVAWRWAAASGRAGGVDLAFNLGGGFGDDRAATENLVVVGDTAIKLGRVDWSYDADDPLGDWTVRSADGRLALTLHPRAPEVGGLDLGSRHQHVVKAYGSWSGTIVLDGGRDLAVEDLIGFAEAVDIAW